MMTDVNITITIDGETVAVSPDVTIMQVLDSLDQPVPLICYHEATKPEGLCRLCVVEIEGWRTLAPACVTKISDGMIIYTESARVKRARRTILEMLCTSVDLSEAPEILSQIEAYDADPDRFPDGQHRQQPVLDDNPFYVRDYAKCLLCWRCVQACGDDMQFTYALSVGGRGFRSTITTFSAAPLPETTCVFCGNCVTVCPTNALQGKTEFFLNQGLDDAQVRLKIQAEKKKNKAA